MHGLSTPYVHAAEEIVAWARLRPYGAGTFADMDRRDWTIVAIALAMALAGEAMIMWLGL